MTEDPSNVTTLLPTTSVQIAAAALVAPHTVPRHIQGTHGEMWQWTGDGTSLFSLVLAVRSDGEESPAGLRHRLIAEVERIARPLRLAPSHKPFRPGIAVVPGARAAFIAHLDGVRDGVPIHNAVLVATRRDEVYVLHVAVPDTHLGREQASKMASSLRLVD